MFPKKFKHPPLKKASDLESKFYDRLQFKTLKLKSLEGENFMRYVIGIIAGVVLIMGAVGGMENDTLNITYSLKMMVIGVIFNL